MPCDLCAAANNNKPPCGTCPKPFLQSEQEVEFYGVIAAVLSQPILSGMGGLAGFNLAVIPTLFEAYDIPKEHWRFLLETIQEISRIAVSQAARISDTQRSKV